MMWRMLGVGGQMLATEIDVAACTFGQMHMAPVGGVYDEHTAIYRLITQNLYTVLCRCATAATGAACRRCQW